MATLLYVNRRKEEACIRPRNVSFLPFGYPTILPYKSVAMDATDAKKG